MHVCTIIFCNVKTKVYDPYLGVCMRLLKQEGAVDSSGLSSSSSFLQ